MKRKSPKYHVGQKFVFPDLENWVHTILAVSPEADHEGEYVYFVEILSDGLDKRYEVAYESTMDDIQLLNRLM